MQTYILFKKQSMLLSETSRKGQPDADLQSVQNPGHALVSNKQEGPARCWLTSCWKPRACSYQQQVGRASQMLTYNLFKTKSMLLSATTRKSQPDADLHPVQNPEHALLSNNQEGPARCRLTCCSKPRACCCQQQPGRASQMQTYTLFKIQSMLLLATCQPDADLHSVQNPEHALVSNKQEGPARCWLTSCSKPKHALVSNKQEGPPRCWLTCCWKPRACSCQQQAGRASQMLTYMLFKTQSMLLSATSRKGQPNADLQAVQNQEHALVSNQQEWPAWCWLTCCSKFIASSCQKYVGRASQMLTYKLFKIQSVLLSATNRRGQPDADLQAVQNSEHALVSNKQEGPARCRLTCCSNPKHALVSKKQEGPARCWLTCCSKFRVCSHQQHASQMLTYILFKIQSMFLSVTSRKGQPDANLHPVQNPEQAIVSNKGPTRCWLTSCSKPRVCSCQYQRISQSKMLTYILFIIKAHSC